MARACAACAIQSFTASRWVHFVRGHRGDEAWVFFANLSKCWRRILTAASFFVSCPRWSNGLELLASAAEDSSFDAILSNLLRDSTVKTSFQRLTNLLVGSPVLVKALL